MEAITAAHQVKITGASNSHSIHSPTMLLRPNITSNKKPTTVGGSTNGSINSVSITTLPLNVRRDIHHAIATPMTITTMLESNATCKESRMGSQKSCQFIDAI